MANRSQAFRDAGNRLRVPHETEFVANQPMLDRDSHTSRLSFSSPKSRFFRHFEASLLP